MRKPPTLSKIVNSNLMNKYRHAVHRYQLCVYTPDGSRESEKIQTKRGIRYEPKSKTSYPYREEPFQEYWLTPFLFGRIDDNMVIKYCCLYNEE